MPVGKSGARSSSSFNLRGDGEKLPQLQTYTKHQVTAPPPQMWKADQGLRWRRCSKNVCSVNERIHGWTPTSESVFVHGKLTPQRCFKYIPSLMKCKSNIPPHHVYSKGYKLNLISVGEHVEKLKPFVLPVVT